jgi:hypothetical protein
MHDLFNISFNKNTPQNIALVYSIQTYFGVIDFMT